MFSQIGVQAMDGNLDSFISSCKNARVQTGSNMQHLKYIFLLISCLTTLFRSQASAKHVQC
jgi:hypothetical protein